METSPETFCGEHCLPYSQWKNSARKTNSTFNNLSSGPEAVINYMGNVCGVWATRGEKRREGGEKKSKPKFDKLS